jgi:hypothetical protein
MNALQKIMALRAYKKNLVNLLTGETIGCGGLPLEVDPVMEEGLEEILREARIRPSDKKRAMLQTALDIGLLKKKENGAPEELELEQEVELVQVLEMEPDSELEEEVDPFEAGPQMEQDLEQWLELEEEPEEAGELEKKIMMKMRKNQMKKMMEKMKKREKKLEK